MNVHPNVQGQYAQPQQYQQPQRQFPRESVTMTGMSVGSMIFHWTMIICTCGFWYPVYAARKHKANRKAVTKYR